MMPDASPYGQIFASRCQERQVLSLAAYLGSRVLPKAGIHSLHLGAISFLNYTENLERKERIHWRRLQKSVETVPRNCRFLSLVVVERVLRYTRIVTVHFIVTVWSACHATTWLCKLFGCPKESSHKERKHIIGGPLSCSCRIIVGTIQCTSAGEICVFPARQEWLSLRVLVYRICVRIYVSHQAIQA